METGGLADVNEYNICNFSEEEVEMHKREALRQQKLGHKFVKK